MRVNLYNPDWSHTGVEEDYHRFFVLLWQEAFNFTTIEMWQPHALDVLGLFEELAHGIDIAHTHPAARQHIPFLVDELRSKVQDSVWAATARPELKRIADMIIANSESHAEVRRLCAVAKPFALPFRDALIGRIRSLLTERGAYKKYELELSLHALFTRLLLDGFSHPFLASIGDLLTSNTDQDLVGRFDLACDFFRHRDTSFRCSVLMGGLRHLSIHTLTSSRFSITDVPATATTEAERMFLYHASAERNSVMIVDVTAEDAWRAARKAIAIATHLAAQASLCFGSHHVSPSGHSVLVTDARGRQLAVHVDSHFQHDPFVFRSRKRQVELAEATLASLGKEDFNRVTTALEYIRLGERAASDESRLMLFWVALESLLRDSGAGTLDGICAAVPYISALARVRRMLFGMCKLMHVASIAKGSKSPNAPFDPVRESRIRPREVLDALIKKDTLLQGMYDVFGDNQLIRFRIHSLANHSLSAGSVIASGIERHRRAVDWQLRRIYRRRNDIVHGGGSSFPLASLIRHLHSYLCVTMEAIVEDNHYCRDWSIADAAAHRRMLYGQVLSELRSAPVLSAELFWRRQPSLI